MSRLVMEPIPAVSLVTLSSNGKIIKGVIVPEDHPSRPEPLRSGPDYLDRLGQGELSLAKL